MSDTSQTERTRRRSATWTILAVVLGSAALGLGVFGWAVWHYAENGWTLEVDMADRERLVTATALDKAISQMVVRTDHEIIEKNKSFAGEVALRYEYEHPSDDLSLIIRCQLLVEPTRKAAFEAYRELDKKSRADLANIFPLGKYDDRNQYYEMGDQSEASVMLEGEEVAAYYFTCRRKNKIFSCIIASPRLQDIEEVFEVISAAASGLEMYDP